MWTRSMTPWNSCSRPIGSSTATHAVGEPRLERLERREEVGPLAVEQVDEDAAATSPSSSQRFHSRSVPTSTPITPETVTIAPSTTRSVAEHVGLEARLARRVDQVDRAALPLEVGDRRRDRHPAPALLVVVVGDRRLLGHAARAGSRFPTRTAGPRPARSCRCRGGRSPRRFGSSRAPFQACMASQRDRTVRPEVIAPPTARS